MSDTPSHAGHFVWHDLMTTDKAKAVAFYTDLIGWQTHDIGDDGWTVTIVKAGEDDVADVMPLDGAAGVPSHWTCYISVDDVDAAVAKTVELGGKVLSPAMDSPYGRMATVQDAGGALFKPHKSDDVPAAGSWPPAPGTFCWFELMTPDTEQASHFYREVVGWGAEQGGMEDTPTGPYYMFKRGDEQVAGMMKKPDMVPVANWLPYVTVADVDAATARVPELGGTVLYPATDIPNTGRFSVIADPTGAAIGLFTAGPMDS